jgi:glutathione synthase/RimK-type ligase-like ATP-grasp enzyme
MSMIGVWASASDPAAAAVTAALRSRGEHVIFIDDEQNVPTGRNRNQIDLVEQPFELGDLSALYVRPNSAKRPDLWRFADEADIPVVNRPSAGITNASKPFQARLIAAAGFVIPDTLITTTPASVRDFLAQHRGEVIYKSISSVRSIVSRWTPDDDARIGDVTFCPTQLQERIPPPDLRVHVVGEEVFGCLVWSEADDYRFAHRSGLQVEMAATAVPPEIRQPLVRLVDSLGLALAGADLRRRADGEWSCLGVNPSPAFTFYTPVADWVADAIAVRLGSRST